MTDREAIEILQEEHDYCQELSYVINAIKQAITALQERDDRERGCECENHTITHPYTNGYSIEVDPKRKEIAIWLSDECVAVMDCAFCPMCGRKLKGGNSDA